MFLRLNLLIIVVKFLYFLCQISIRRAAEVLMNNCLIVIIIVIVNLKFVIKFIIIQRISTIISEVELCLSGFFRFWIRALLCPCGWLLIIFSFSFFWAFSKMGLLGEGTLNLIIWYLFYFEVCHNSKRAGEHREDECFVN